MQTIYINNYIYYLYIKKEYIRLNIFSKNVIKLIFFNAIVIFNIKS